MKYNWLSTVLFWGRTEVLNLQNLACHTHLSPWGWFSYNISNKNKNNINHCANKQLQAWSHLFPTTLWSRKCEFHFLNGVKAQRLSLSIRVTRLVGMLAGFALRTSVLCCLCGTYGKLTGFRSFIEKRSIPLIIERFTSMYENSSSSTW